MNKIVVKVVQIGEKEVKPPRFADGTIFYVENPKESIEKLLERVRKFSKAAGYKIDMEINCISIYQQWAI